MQINDKSALRRYFRDVRKNMPQQEREELSRRIERSFLDSSLYKNTSAVLIYVSSPIEVDTNGLIENCFRDGKRVLVPRCLTGGNVMEFCEIDSFDMRISGAFGISEPDSSVKAAAEIPDDSVCVTPGLAFDKSGHRLGFGKGFYDRFLADYKGIAAGLCYENGLCDCVFHEEHDIAVDMLFTEKDVYVFG